MIVGHPVVAFGVRTVGVREPIELDMIIFGDHVLEAVEYVLQPRRSLDRLKPKRRQALQGDLRDHPSAPRPTRAAMNRSGFSAAEQRSCEPSAVIIVSPRT